MLTAFAKSEILEPTHSQTPDTSSTSSAKPVSMPSICCRVIHQSVSSTHSNSSMETKIKTHGQRDAVEWEAEWQELSPLAGSILQRIETE